MLNKKYAFTLIEVLVAITIISILVIGGSQIDFRRINDAQKLEMFNNSIVGLFENIRNNALLGKGIGTDLEVPEKWKITFSGSGITTQYSLSNDIWEPYAESITGEEYIEIDNFDCFTINGDSGKEDMIKESIIFQGKDMIFDGNCNTSDKILKFDTHYKKTFHNTFSINTLNGLIEID